MRWGVIISEELLKILNKKPVLNNLKYDKPVVCNRYMLIKDYMHNFKIKVHNGEGFLDLFFNDKKKNHFKIGEFCLTKKKSLYLDKKKIKKRKK